MDEIELMRVIGTYERCLIAINRQLNKIILAIEELGELIRTCKEWSENGRPGD